MSVKRIFLTLIGTIVFMLVSFIMIEVFNMNIVATQLNNMSKTSAYQTCALFTQETYKEDGNFGGATSMPSINDSDGDFYITGQFYNGSSTSAIWHNLYSTGNTDFVSAMTPLRSQYTNLNLLMKGIESNGAVPTVAINWNSSDSDIQNNMDAAKANTYYKTMYTPANLGIPYLDPDTTNRIFKWELAQLFSNCDTDNIHKDENGKQFVMYKGFRCYVQDATITNFTYKVYDLSEETGAVASNAHQLEIDTGLTVDGYTAHRAGEGIIPSTTADLVGRSIKDNALITAVEIDYQVPVAYEGITPVKSWFSYIFSNSVSGFDGTGSISNPEEFDTTQVQNIDSVNNTGTVPTSGKLIFTLVR